MQIHVSLMCYLFFSSHIDVIVAAYVHERMWVTVFALCRSDCMLGLVSLYMLLAPAVCSRSSSDLMKCCKGS